MIDLVLLSWNKSFTEGMFSMKTSILGKETSSFLRSFITFRALESISSKKFLLVHSNSTTLASFNTTSASSRPTFPPCSLKFSSSHNGLTSVAPDDPLEPHTISNKPSHIRIQILVANCRRGPTGAKGGKGEGGTDGAPTTLEEVFILAIS